MMTRRPAEATPVMDSGERVRVAQDKLTALTRTAQVTGDPSGPVLEGLSDTLAAFHGLTFDVGQQLRPHASQYVMMTFVGP